MGRGKRQGHQGQAPQASATAVLDIPTFDDGTPRYGVTSRKALGLDAPISPLYPLPDDKPAPDAPIDGAPEVAALGPVNAVRQAFGYGPLNSLRGRMFSRGTRQDAVAWALSTALPRGAEVRFADQGMYDAEGNFRRSERGVELRVPNFGEDGYEQAVALVEKLATTLGVELRRGPEGAPLASYGGDSFTFSVPLPASVRDYLAVERAPGWQPRQARPKLPRRLEKPLMGPTIKKKAQMYALYEKGAFGNKLRTWSSVAELKESGYSGLVTLRYKSSAGGGGWAAYDVDPKKVDEVVAKWVSEGADPKLVVANESAPDDRLVVQGDVGVRPYGGGLVFRFSTIKDKMRNAMKTADHAYGAEATVLLEQYLSAGSLADVRELLELFPDAIVEFSAYEMNVGCVPGRNAVIWEVRNY